MHTMKSIWTKTLAATLVVLLGLVAGELSSPEPAEASHQCNWSHCGAFGCDVSFNFEECNFNGYSCVTVPCQEIPD